MCITFEGPSSTTKIYTEYELVNKMDYFSISTLLLHRRFAIKRPCRRNWAITVNAVVLLSL